MADKPIGTFSGIPFYADASIPPGTFEMRPGRKPVYEKIDGHVFDQKGAAMEEGEVCGVCNGGHIEARHQRRLDGVIDRITKGHVPAAMFVDRGNYIESICGFKHICSTIGSADQAPFDGCQCGYCAVSRHQALEPEGFTGGPLVVAEREDGSPEGGLLWEPPGPDDPFWDGTDGAHPAWWRGNDAGVHAVVEKLQAALDGKDDGHGVVGYEPLERLRRRLIALAEIEKAASGPALLGLLCESGVGLLCESGVDLKKDGEGFLVFRGTVPGAAQSQLIDIVHELKCRGWPHPNKNGTPSSESKAAKSGVKWAGIWETFKIAIELNSDNRIEIVAFDEGAVNEMDRHKFGHVTIAEVCDQAERMARGEKGSFVTVPTAEPAPDDPMAAIRDIARSR